MISRRFCVECGALFLAPYVLFFLLTLLESLR